MNRAWEPVVVYCDCGWQLDPSSVMHPIVPSDEPIEIGCACGRRMLASIWRRQSVAIEFPPSAMAPGLASLRDDLRVPTRELAARFASLSVPPNREIREGDPPKRRTTTAPTQWFMFMLGLSMIVPVAIVLFLFDWWRGQLR